MIWREIQNFFLSRRNEKEKRKHEMSNTINSMFNSQYLYDQLKVKCHPDRFPCDENKRKRAEYLFQELQKNRYNIEILKKIEVEIYELLKD